MTLEEFFAKYPKIANTAQGTTLFELERSASKFALLLNSEHDKMLEHKRDFQFEDAEVASLEQAAKDRKLTRVTHEKDASGKDATYVDTDHPRLAAARASRDRAKAAYKTSRERYETMRKTGCGDAAVLSRCLGYLSTTPAARKAIYAANGV